MSRPPTTSPDKHITELTLELHSFNGYRVVVSRAGQKFIRYFSVSKLGWEGALEAATRFRDRLLKLLEPLPLHRRRKDKPYSIWWSRCGKRWRVKYGGKIKSFTPNKNRSKREARACAEMWGEEMSVAHAKRRAAQEAREQKLLQRAADLCKPPKKVRR